MRPFIVISSSIITLDFRDFINNFENPPVIITGGYSKLFTNSLKSKVIIDKDITIKGLIRTIKLIDF